jgi:hypothetical protein
MKKIYLLVFVLLLVLIGVIFFLTREDASEEMSEDVVGDEPTEQEKDPAYSGKVGEFGEDFFVLEVAMYDNSVDMFEMDEEVEPEVLSIKVNIDERTSIVDANDVKYVEIPEEYSRGLSPFEYVRGLVEEYALAVVVESTDVFENDGDEIYASKVSWSCYPL